MTPQPEFHYPLFCFTTDGDLWSLDTPDDLEHCGPETWRDKLQLGMDVVDAQCRCWRVRDIALAPPTPFHWRSLIPFRGRRIRITHTFERQPDLSIEEVRARLFAAFDAHPQYYCADGESLEEIEDMKRELLNLKTLTPMHEVVGADRFGY